VTLLKLSLKRGALVTAANWQVVLVQFVADTLFKTLVAVPVVGGLVLVALIVGGNPMELLRFDDLTQTISSMVGVLLALVPASLVAGNGGMITDGAAEFNRNAFGSTPSVSFFVDNLNGPNLAFQLGWWVRVSGCNGHRSRHLIRGCQVP
jgi:hypothetical protein